MPESPVDRAAKALERALTTDWLGRSMPPGVTRWTGSTAELIEHGFRAGLAAAGSCEGSVGVEDKVLLAKVEAKLEQTRDLLEERTRERDQAGRERDINADHIRRLDLQGRCP
jgi:hypothetical protein